MGPQQAPPDGCKGGTICSHALIEHQRRPAPPAPACARGMDMQRTIPASQRNTYIPGGDTHITRIPPPIRPDPPAALTCCCMSPSPNSAEKPGLLPLAALDGENEAPPMAMPPPLARPLGRRTNWLRSRLEAADASACSWAPVAAAAAATEVAEAADAKRRLPLSLGRSAGAEAAAVAASSSFCACCVPATELRAAGLPTLAAAPAVPPADEDRGVVPAAAVAGAAAVAAGLALETVVPVASCSQSFDTRDANPRPSFL